MKLYLQLVLLLLIATSVWAGSGRKKGGKDKDKEQPKPARGRTFSGEAEQKPTRGRGRTFEREEDVPDRDEEVERCYGKRQCYVGGKNPVCGENNVTYINDCYRKCARVKKQKEGSC